MGDGRRSRQILIGFAVAFVFVLPVVGTPAVAATNYTQPVWFEWQTETIDIVVVPPAHGPLYNLNQGPLPNGVDGALPTGQYLEAIMDAIANWRYARDQFAATNPGYAWVSGITINAKILGLDTLTPTDVTLAEILVVTDETKGVILGLATLPPFPKNKCWILTSSWFVSSFNYQDFFNVAGHEIGHCLGLDHSTGNVHDILFASYNHSPGVPGTHLHCQSNLNIKTMANSFADYFGQADGGQTAVVADSAYVQYCGPGLGPGNYGLP